ncbi:ATP-grasp domain-containing protein [Chitinophaga sp. Hz27]|uniref:ATP-grasp domain-containing protein n=1 Tax=Chitinophaga sp. Hz27 TaxID=3347169 RepID=UPI0035DF8E55
MSTYTNIQWVVQQNLTTPTHLQQIQSACNAIGIPVISVMVIPFTDTLPDFNRERKSIIYGSTTFHAIAAKDPLLMEGVFYDEDNFSMANYLDIWKDHMLNYGAITTTFHQLITQSSFPHDKLLFIRPDGDTKSFAGEVKRFDEIESWYKQAIQAGNFDLNEHTSIVAGEPYNIAKEWRLWIVNKKVVAASQYREYFKLKKITGCPENVIAFAEARCKEYTPHDVFVMDICLCSDQLYIVECGTMNAAGFYEGNVFDIVKAVSDYFVKR